MAKRTVASIWLIPTCRRKPRLKNLSLIPATVNLVTVDWLAALLFHWVTFMSVETTATNCPQQSLIWLFLEPSKVYWIVVKSGRSEKKRERTRMTFFFHGKRICKEAFLFLHCISWTKFCSLVKHYKKNGLTLRSHGNKKWLPSSTFSAESVDNVVKFILNDAEDRALLLPGRVPGFKRVDVKLLPSVLTKHSLWKTYVQAMVKRRSGIPNFAIYGISSALFL